MLTISKHMGEFAAAHTLVNHDGGCANLHGHNYGVEVTLIGSPQEMTGSNSESGMLIDFTAVKEIYKKHVHEVVDHATIFGVETPLWYSVFTAYVAALEKAGDLHAGIVATDVYLGKVAHLPIPETTAEYFAKWIFETIEDNLPEFLEKSEEFRRAEVMVYSVSVWETLTSKATYTNPLLSPGLTARFEGKSE